MMVAYKPGEIYVGDVDKWIRFYRNMAAGNIPPQRARQAGGRLGNRGRSSMSSIIPVDVYSEHPKNAKESNKFQIQVTAPTEQIVKQAESQLVQQNEAKLKQIGGKVIKRPNSMKKSTSSNKSKQSRRVKKAPATKKTKKATNLKKKVKAKKTIALKKKIARKTTVLKKKVTTKQKKKTNLKR